MALCSILGFDCPNEDLCRHCIGSGEEPVTASGSDPCCHCDRCFDEQIGWSTGIEPNTPTVASARRYVEASNAERDKPD